MPRIDPTLALYALALAIGGALFVLFFWAIAAVKIQTGSGLIAQLGLSGLWQTLFYAYPFVTFLAVVGGIVAYLVDRYEAALGFAGLPVAGVAVYYLALTLWY